MKVGKNFWNVIKNYVSRKIFYVGKMIHKSSGQSKIFNSENWCKKTKFSKFSKSEKPCKKIVIE